eukprot:3158573-Rhodomonas_salina.1
MESRFINEVLENRGELSAESVDLFTKRMKLECLYIIDVEARGLHLRRHSSERRGPRFGGGEGMKVGVHAAYGSAYELEETDQLWPMETRLRLVMSKTQMTAKLKHKNYLKPLFRSGPVESSRFRKEMARAQPNADKNGDSDFCAPGHPPLTHCCGVQGPL